MACSVYYESQYDRFYQAVKNYDIKSLVREAANQRILTDAEKSEIDKQKNGHLMRKYLINLILPRGTRGQEQFIGFIQDFSFRAYEQTRQLAGFQPYPTSYTIKDVGYGKELPQLSQDSSESAGSISPMELDTNPMDSTLGPDDRGYFSFSSGSLSNDPLYDSGYSTTQPGLAYTSTSFMENELKRVQGNHRDLQRYVRNKQQSHVPAFSFPSVSGESSQTAPISSVNNYTVNVFNISSNCGSDKPGAHNMYPLTASQSPDSVDCESMQPQAEKRRESEWNCVNKHHCRIIELLNVDALLPHLWEKGLLTRSERDTLYSKYLTPCQKATHLLTVLPRKGKCAFELFKECLSDCKDHLGHEDVLKCLVLSSQIPIEV